MLLNLLGWIWIITGVVFLLNPEKLKNKLIKKSVKKLKKIFIGIALFVGILLIKATWGVPGLLAKIVMIFGLIGIIKAIYLYKGKTADSMIEWFLNQPIKYYRICAVVHIAIGAIILTV